MIANIWECPKTTVAGVLIAVATVAGVLSQQGITLGTAGTGTVVSLIAALATALLGLLAKDPGSSTSSTSGSTTAKLGAWALIALLIPATCIPLSGCDVSSNQLKATAQVLATALSGLSSAISTTDADTASKLSLAAQSLTAVTNNWDTSSSAGLLNTAASGVEAVLAGISSTSKYASLVAIAVAAVDAILAATASSSKASTHYLSVQQSGTLSIYRAQAKGLMAHRFGRSQAGDFKDAWNRAISDGHFAVPLLK